MFILRPPLPDGSPPRLPTEGSRSPSSSRRRYSRSRSPRRAREARERERERDGRWRGSPGPGSRRRDRSAPRREINRDLRRDRDRDRDRERERDRDRERDSRYTNTAGSNRHRREREREREREPRTRSRDREREKEKGEEGYDRDRDRGTHMDMESSRRASKDDSNNNSNSNNNRDKERDLSRLFEQQHQQQHPSASKAGEKMVITPIKLKEAEKQRKLAADQKRMNHSNSDKLQRSSSAEEEDLTPKKVDRKKAHPKSISADEKLFLKERSEKLHKDVTANNAISTPENNNNNHSNENDRAIVAVSSSQGGAAEELEGDELEQQQANNNNNNNNNNSEGGEANTIPVAVAYSIVNDFLQLWNLDSKIENALKNLPPTQIFELLHDKEFNLRNAHNPCAVVQSKLTALRHKQSRGTTSTGKNSGGKNSSNKNSTAPRLPLADILKEVNGFIDTFELDKEVEKLLKFRLTPEDLEDCLYNTKLSDQLDETHGGAAASKLVKEWVENRNYQLMHVKKPWSLFPNIFQPDFGTVPLLELVQKLMDFVTSKNCDREVMFHLLGRMSLNDALDFVEHHNRRSPASVLAKVVRVRT